MRAATLGILMSLAVVLPGCFAMQFVPVSQGAKGPASPHVEVVRFPTTDGLTLEGRFYPARADVPKQSPDDPDYPRLPEMFDRAAILHCHGAGDNNTSAMAAFMSDAGFRVFQFDYRGVGHSDAAPPSNRGYAADAVAALAYLRSRPDVDPDRIVVYGHSMGAGYAMAAAAEAARAGRPVRAVISVAGFHSWRAISSDRVPVLGFLLGGVRGPDPTDHARALGQTPLLIAHTSDDEEIPVSHATAIYRAASAAGVPATLLIHPKGGHLFPFWGEPQLEAAIVEYARFFLDDERPLTLEEFQEQMERKAEDSASGP